MPVIEVDGWTLAYEEHGAGDPVVFLHGLLMDRTMWSEQVAALAGSYRCIAVDAPGHGESPMRAPGYTLEDVAESLAGFCRAVGIDSAVWVGHSMGGMTALRLALAHPDLVRGLALVDTQPGAESPDLKPQYDAMIEVVKTDGPSEDLAAVVGAIMFGAPALETEEGRRWVKHFASLDGHAVEGGARAVFDRDDIRERMGEIGAPALVVHGTDDVAIPVELARRYAPTLPAAQLVELPGAGHTGPVEQPGAVTDALRAFLSAL